MIKVEAKNLKEAYEKAAESLSCSVTELRVEIIQKPNPGILGFFTKTAIIVAVYDPDVKHERKSARKSKKEELKEAKVTEVKRVQEVKKEKKPARKPERKPARKPARKPENKLESKKVSESKKEKKERVHRTSEVKQSRRDTSKKHRVLNDTIMPASFVHDQDDDEYEEHLSSGLDYTADYDDEYDDYEEITSIEQKAIVVEDEINNLFDFACFEIEKIEVSVYDDNTLLIEFKGNDSALLIGKEGYRYKALSYMIFNWINSKYDVQLRLEIAEFLANQEEAVERYLVNVREMIQKDGRVQTKILDGVLVQIALKKLREEYPEKYVVIRSTRDGLKYIIVNDYHSN